MIIGVALFVGIHVLFIVRPLFTKQPRVAGLLGLCIFLSVFGLYTLNGVPALATAPPASFDVVTSLINQSLTLSKSNPQKALALLREAMHHAPSPSQKRIIDILRQASENAEHMKPITPQ